MDGWPVQHPHIYLYPLGCSHAGSLPEQFGEEDDPGLVLDVEAMCWLHHIMLQIDQEN